MNGRTKRERLTGRSAQGQKSKPGMALIPEEVMNSPVYIALPIATRHLLTEIAIQFRPSWNNGSLCLAYDAVFEQRGWKRSLFYKSCKQLAKSGFIVITRKGGNRLATYCALAWRDIERPLPKVGSYDPGIDLGRAPHKPWIKSVADHPTLSRKLAGGQRSEAPEKRGAASQPVDRDSCSVATRYASAETSDVLQTNPLKGARDEKTGCQPAPYKSFCHRQATIAPIGGRSTEKGSTDYAANEVSVERIAKARTECPLLTGTGNVIPLSIVRRRREPTEGSQMSGPNITTAELESVAAEFRELLVVGGLTPIVVEKRVTDLFATNDHESVVGFMRKFIATYGGRIRAERKPPRTSGALAAAVRWHKPSQRVA